MFREKEQVKKVEQCGQVIKIVGAEKALVKVQQNQSCQECGACAGFFGDPADTGHLMVEVINPIGAREGETVRLETRSQEVLYAAFLLYLLPVFALLAGLFVGRSLVLSKGLSLSPDLAGLALGLIGMFLVFFILRRQEKNFEAGKRFKAVITAVINESDWLPD